MMSIMLKSPAFSFTNIQHTSIMQYMTKKIMFMCFQHTFVTVFATKSETLGLEISQSL